MKRELMEHEERASGCDCDRLELAGYELACDERSAKGGREDAKGRKTYTKNYLLAGLNCPNCSAKIEREVGQLPYVSSSTVNLIKQTLRVEVEENAVADIFGKVEAIVHKYEPDIKVSEMTDEREKKEQPSGKWTIIRLAVGAMIYLTAIILMYVFHVPWGASLALYIVAYLILGADVVLKAAKNITRGRIFDENFLMTISTVGAFIIGEYPEAVAVMLFYQVGELFQDMAVYRSRKNIVSLMDIRPDVARVIRNSEPISVSPETVSVGEIILCRPGEKIPLDGVVLRGSSMLDTAALTGESAPKAVGEGDDVLSGCINMSGTLEIKVNKPFGESTVAKIIDLVQNASEKKAKTENFITTFARYYTPAVVVLAALLAVLPPLAFGGNWIDWINRGFVFLVISCPCALVISVPLAFFGGIGAASRHGVLVKGGNYLESLSKLGTVVFDKTGTLTKGYFEVTETFPAEGFDRRQLMEYAAIAESSSNHPIAASIRRAFGGEITPTDAEEIAGMGVKALWRGKTLLAGNAKLMKENGITYCPIEKPGTKVYVAVSGIYAGCVLISDAVKPDSKVALERLKELGVEKTVMLTGDNAEIAEAVANELGIDEFHAELLPSDKVNRVEALIGRDGKTTAFVGDGINDAPVLARADLGIAMGGLGSDAAIEAADVVLMTDEPSKISDAVRVARSTKRIVIQNIVFALAVKVAFLALGALGIAGMWEAVFGDVGVAVLAILNSMRMIKK